VQRKWKCMDTEQDRSTIDSNSCIISQHHYSKGYNR
jgi:hypothetical protein